MQATRDFSHYVRHLDSGLSHIDLAVEGVSCAGCMSKIERGLSAFPDVTLARVNLTDRRVALEWKEGTLDPARFIDRLAELGYKAYPFEPVRAEADETEQASFLLRCLGVAAFAAMNIMMLSIPVWSGNVSDMIPEQRDFFHWLSALIALPAAAYSGQPFFRSAWRALRARHTNMDVPISIGIVLALGMSVAETIHHAEHAYFDAALMLLAFLLAGRYLDQSMRRKTRAVAGNLAALKAETATKFVGADEIGEVPVAAVRRRRYRAAAPGRAIGRRRRRDRGTVRDRPEPDHRRNLAATAEPGDLGLCRHAQSVRRAAGAGFGGVRRHAAGGNHAGCSTMPCRRAPAMCTSPTAPRGSMPRWCMRRRCSPCSAGLLAGASWHDAIVTAIAVLIITCPCALGLAIPTVQTVVVRRDVPGRRAAQFRRCDRAARRGRPRHLRQDRHADAAGTRRHQCRRYPARRVRSRRTAGAGKPSSGCGRGRARLRRQDRRWPASRRSRGRVCAASSTGEEVRLGRPSFCGADRFANEILAPRSGSLGRRFPPWRRLHVFAVRQRLRADAAAPSSTLRKRAASKSRSSRATASLRSGSGASARDPRMARRRHAGRQDRPHRGIEAAGLSR